MKKARLILIASVIVLCLFSARPAFAQLTLNLIAVNASESDPKEIDVKYYLPKELGPTDILDAADLKVDYDVDKGSYFVYGKVQFAPKESKTFKIRVNDVWVINTAQIEDMKKQVDENIALLKNDSSYEIVKSAREKIFQKLDYILDKQNSHSENIDRRIEEYRAYTAMLKEIENNIYSLDALKTEAKAMEETNQEKTIKLVLQVANPSKTEEKKVQEKHYLPEEIRSEQVLDAQGFDVRFDEKKAKSYLSKETTFKPGEEKKYEVVIKDVWWLPTAKIDSLDTRAKDFMAELKGSDFETRGQLLFDGAQEKITLIKDSQVDGLPIKEHIGIFRINGVRYDNAKDDVEKLEQLVAVLRLKKLQELESKSVKNILQKLQALRGLQAISDAIFKKKIPVTITWKIIIATLGFIAFFTTLHFFIWAGRSKTMGEELGPKKGEGLKEVPKPGQEPKKE